MFTWIIGYGISEEEADPRPIMGSSEVRNMFNTTTNAHCHIFEPSV